MRITRLHVDGFGALHDVDVALRQQLGIILGPNEAGKSTLLHFCTGVLFGFGRRGSAAYHPQVRGGRHGGLIEIVDDAGDLWTIERYTAPTRVLAVHRPDGSPGTEEDLSRLLGRASADLFSAVFAVDLDGLAQIRNVSSNEVKEVLFSSAVMGQRRSASKVSQELAAVQAGLARPRQGDAAANRISSRLQSVRAELAAARAAADGLPALQREIARLESERSGLNSKERQLLDREAELGLLKGLWERLSAGRDAADKLSEIPPLDMAAKRLLDCEDEVHRAVTAWSGHASRLLQLDEQRRRLDGIQENVRAGLAALGAGVTEADAPRIRHDVSTRQALRKLVDTDRTLRARLEDAVVAAGSAGGEAAETERMLIATSARPAGDGRAAQVEEAASVPRSAASLQSSARSLTELRRRLAERRDLTSQLQLAEERRPASGVRSLSTFSLVLLVSACAALAAAAVSGVLHQAAALAVAALVVGLALVAAALWPLRRSADQAAGRVRWQDVGTDGPVSGASAPAAGEHLDDLQRLRRQLHELDARVAELSRQLGLPTHPTASDVEVCAEAVEAELNERRLLDEASGRCHAARMRASEAGRLVGDIEDQIRQAERDFSAWKGEAGLWPECNLETAAAALEVAAQLQKDIAARVRVTAAVAELERTVQAFVRELRELADGLDEPMPPYPDEQDAWLKTLDRRLADHRERQLRREMLEAAVTRAEAEVERSLGRGARADELRSRLGTGAVLEWQEELDLIAGEIATIRLEEEELVRRHEATRQDLGALLASERIAELENLEAALEHELDRTLISYMTVACARHLITSTLERYEEERQPEVVRRASEHFCHITGGRYPVVILDPSDGNKPAIRVRSSSGGSIDACDLSRGTVEQLYLSLRLGLAEEFADRSVALPIILDDVLVNFDEDRARAVLDDLARTAERHQVLLFTCHEPLVEMAERAHPETQVVRLGRPST